MGNLIRKIFIYALALLFTLCLCVACNQTNKDSSGSDGSSISASNTSDTTKESGDAEQSSAIEETESSEESKTSDDISKVSVTFIIDGEKTVVSIEEGECVEEPVLEGKEGYEIRWICNGKDYDFSAPIYEDITIELVAEKWGDIVSPI